MDELKKKRLEDAEKYFKIEEYAKAKKIYDEILSKDDFNVEAQCGWIKSVIKYFKFEVGCLKKNEPRQKNKDVWFYIEEIHKRYNYIEKLEDKKNYEKFLQGYSEIVVYLKNEYKKLLEDEERCNKLTKIVAEEFPSKKDDDYYQKRYILLDNLLGYTTNSRNFRLKIYYATHKAYKSDLYRVTGIYFLRDGSAFVTYINVDENKIHDENVSLIFSSTKVSNLDELEPVLNEFVERCKQGKFKIKKAKKGLFSSIMDKIKGN